MQSHCYIYDFIHLWLHWVCLHCRAGFSLTVASGATLQLWRAGFSLPCLLLLGSRAPVAAACGPTSCFSWVLGHRLSSYSSAACGILPDQESNPCLLHWQADSLPLSHEGSPPFIGLSKWTESFLKARMKSHTRLVLYVEDPH